MSFLRLIALTALPLALLPIVIHLLHRRRHPVVPWAATMFLRRATATRRGPARLRRYLVLGSRVLIVVALVVAFARPLSSTSFGVAVGKGSGRQASSVVILDRSPSMQRRLGNALPTRLQTATQRVAAALETLGVEEFTLIESVSRQPIRMSEPARLIDAARAKPASSSANIPELLLDALVVLENSGEGVADVWLCTDRQFGDWRLSSSQWENIRSRLSRRGKGLRVHLLDFGESPAGNASVRVTDVRSARDTNDELAIDLVVESDQPDLSSVPVRVTLAEATTVAEVSLRDGVGTLSDFHLPLAGGWKNLRGRVSIPSDLNTADDQWFFVAPEDAARQTVLVSETDCPAVRLALGVLGEVRVVDAPTLTLDQLDSVACVVWQGAPPAETQMAALQTFVRSGGSLVFFPSRSVVTPSVFEGVTFEAFEETRGESSFEDYVFPFDRVTPVRGPLTVDADVVGIGTVIGSQRIGTGEVSYCGFDVTSLTGAFVEDGAVLYGLLSSAVEAGARRRLGAGSYVAGEELPEAITQRSDAAQAVMATHDVSGSFEFGSHAGVFEFAKQGDQSGRLIAINRDVSESATRRVTDEELQELFGDFTVNRVEVSDRGLQSEASFVREIWTGVWWLLIGLLIAESWLSLPRVRGKAT
ncbi:MAG: BatA domain-containing protein [Planctomycetota bacterium]